MAIKDEGPVFPQLPLWRGREREAGQALRYLRDASDPRCEMCGSPVIAGLVERGVYILENVPTAELAADEAYEFLFVLGAPRFKGAVQSVVHPIAIR